jgi:hypothetical protein
MEQRPNACHERGRESPLRNSMASAKLKAALVPFIHRPLCLAVIVQ